MADLVLVDTVDRVRTVTLNRPEARNALSVALQREAGAALAAADADPDVDVVILTGTDPAFCAGLDLRELGHGRVEPRRRRGRRRRSARSRRSGRWPSRSSARSTDPA